MNIIHKPDLSYTITLRDGRTITTVVEAIALIGELPAAQHRSLVWQAALAILNKAHETGKTRDIRRATVQFAKALQIEGLMN